MADLRGRQSLRWGTIGLPNERELIQSLTEDLSSERNRAGFSSDCAVMGLDGLELVATIDSFARATHFPEGLSPRLAGELAAGAALSDLAAAGADVQGAMPAYGIPRTMDQQAVEHLAEGIAARVEAAGGEILGGDTKPREQLALTIAALGTCPPGDALLRSRARPGDRIIVTGSLGGAGAALDRVRDGLSPDEADPLVPPDRTRTGVQLREYGAHACMDLSDGLADAAVAISQASGVGVEIERDAIPLHPWAQEDTERGVEHALSTGGDYELAAAVPEQLVEAILAELAEEGLSAAIVGHVEEGQGARLSTAEASTPLKRGYEHTFGDR